MPAFHLFVRFHNFIINCVCCQSKEYIEYDSNEPEKGEVAMVTE